MKDHKSKKQKHLCKLKKKDVEENLKKIASMVNNPRFICNKCARAANEDGILCHPQVIK